MATVDPDTPTFLAIGHAARDIVPAGWRWGGTVTYAALLARAWGVRAGVLTSLAPEDADSYRGLLGDDVLLHVVPSPVTTTMENIYSDAGRQQLLHAKATRIEPRHVPSAWRNAPTVLVGPIISETSTRMGGHFPAGTLAGMAIQGRLRSHQQGRIYTRRWTRAEHEFPSYSVIFFSDEDVGGSESLIRYYTAQTPLAVMTQGDGGATLFDRGHATRFPVAPATPVDLTGAGDIFAAAFLLAFGRTGDPSVACRYANAASACSIEHDGASGVPALEQVEARLRLALG